MFLVKPGALVRGHAVQLNEVIRMSFKKKGVAVFAAAALSVSVASGVAYAYWTAQGTGAGSAAVATTVPLIVSQHASTTHLTPGGDPVALSGSVENPNDSAIRVSGVKVTVGNMPGTSCSPRDFLITGSVAPFDLAATPAGVGWKISGEWKGLNIQMINTGANQDGCKGLNVPLIFTVG